MTKEFKFYAIKISLFVIIIFILQVFIPGFEKLFLLNKDSWFQPWRFLTAIFLHGGIIHLIYNLFALAFFGSVLEKLIGEKKFLQVFLVSGIFANLISVNFYSNSLGASGAIFGIIGALIIAKPMFPVWAFGLPMPIFIAGILWAAGDIIGVYGFFIEKPLDNTGNIAHLSGMLIGFLFGFLYRKPRAEKPKKAFHISEKEIKNWEEKYLKKI